VINAYNPVRESENDQRYNAGMFMMDAGSRDSVWEQFDPKRSPAVVQADPNTVGSDQAWIRYHLGRNEARWTNADGVYEARQVRRRLPADARLVLFAGKRDPSLYPYPWIRSHWR
jgi:hypothetical protein